MEPSQLKDPENYTQCEISVLLYVVIRNKCKSYVHGNLKVKAYKKGY